MSEAKKGFLGLSTSEWSRALSSGGLSLVLEGNKAEEAPEIAVLTREETLAKAKGAAAVMLAAKSELDSMPREVLIDAAWQGVAHYHQQATIWGPTEVVQAIEKEKDFRLSLLTDDEREQAISRANDWLDEHFDQ